MSVDELIIALQELSKQGFGDAEVQKYDSDRANYEIINAVSVTGPWGDGHLSRIELEGRQS